MSNPDEILPPQRLLTMRIVAGALLLGVLIFLGLVLFMVLVQNNGVGTAPPGDLPILSLLAVAFFVIQAPLSFIVPRFQLRTALRQIASATWKLPPGASATDFRTDASKLLAVRQTSMIVGLALLEGAAFFACIAYLLEAQPWVLATVLAAVLLMIVTFPSEGESDPG
jgi:hypothetical protein